MKHFDSRKKVALVVAGLCALLSVPSLGTTADDAPPSVVDLAVKSASTPLEHEALAAYFREKVAEARAEVVRHRRMGMSYSGISHGTEASMAMHCKKLVAAAEEAAQEYEAMATYHDGEAKKVAH